MDVWHPTDEGYLTVQGLRIFWRRFRGGKKGTVLCLHGGPGCASDYMLPMSDLARSGYDVVLYDQMGCGRSELPKNKDFLTVERHLQEVEGMRQGLGLGRVHLVGHSWGGMLAIEYALRHQSNLKSLVLSGALSSMPVYAIELEKSKARLPRTVSTVLRRYESEGDYKDPQYLEASMAWYRKHICRLPEWPPEVRYATEQGEGPVFQTMWGPSELVCSGNLRYWDVRSQLGRIRTRCLVTNGRYDNVAPQIGRSIHAAIEGSEFVVLEGSGHMTMWDQRDKFISVVRAFLEGQAP